MKQKEDLDSEDRLFIIIIALLVILIVAVGSIVVLLQVKSNIDVGVDLCIPASLSEAFRKVSHFF